MWNLVRITAAAALVLGAGIVHGSWTHRWGASREMAGLAARFGALPMTIGEWKATPFEIDERELRMAGAEASLSRVYTNPRGTSVSVLLLGGLPGHIATHTPDICYRGAGFELNPPEPFEHRPGAGHDGPRATLRTARAVRGGTEPSTLRIFWTWRGPKGWDAPEDARWKFANEPSLCKLYVVRQTGGADVPPDRDPANEFLDLLLPELERAVFPTAG